MGKSKWECDVAYVPWDLETCSFKAENNCVPQIKCSSRCANMTTYSRQFGFEATQTEVKYTLAWLDLRHEILPRNPHHHKREWFGITCLWIYSYKPVSLAVWLAHSLQFLRTFFGVLTTYSFHYQESVHKLSRVLYYLETTQMFPKMDRGQYGASNGLLETKDGHLLVKLANLCPSWDSLTSTWAQQRLI